MLASLYWNIQSISLGSLCLHAVFLSSKPVDCFCPSSRSFSASRLCLGAVDETVTLVVMTWTYNDLFGADEHLAVRNIMPAAGFACCSSGSARIGAGHRSRSLNRQISNSNPVSPGISMPFLHMSYISHQRWVRSRSVSTALLLSTGALVEHDIIVLRNGYSGQFSPSTKACGGVSGLHEIIEWIVRVGLDTIFRANGMLWLSCVLHPSGSPVRRLRVGPSRVLFGGCRLASCFFVTYTGFALSALSGL